MANNSITQKTLDHLEDLEQHLKAQALWDEAMPEPSRLLSSQPFASDTLEFYQWIQFIMIPSLRQCVEQRKPLPNKIAVSPMAVEVWKGKLKEHRQIILALKAIDELLDGHHGRH
ncbi:YqcC family protein [Aliidiomarina iranensis]|nr:YqcC family protein [Aliidiomarina iranensis]